MRTRVDGTDVLGTYVRMTEGQTDDGAWKRCGDAAAEDSQSVEGAERRRAFYLPGNATANTPVTGQRPSHKMDFTMAIDTTRSLPLFNVELVVVLPFLLDRFPSEQASLVPLFFSVAEFAVEYPTIFLT